MKKALLSLFVVGMMATAANAAVLSMAWNDGGVHKPHIITPAGATAQLDILFAFEATDNAGNIVDGMALRMVGSLLDKLDVQGFTNTLAWDQSSSLAIPGPLETAYFYGNKTGATGTAIAGDNTPQAAQVIYSIMITNNLGDGEVADVAFNATAPLPGVFNGSAPWLHNTFSPTNFPGSFSMGQGSPGVPFSDAAPVTIATPEPASLALLALGGIALIRRR